MASSIGSTALHIGVDDSQFGPRLDHASKRFKKYAHDTEADAKALNRHVAGLLSFGNLPGLGMVAGGVGGLLAGFSLGSFVIDSIKIAAEMEDIAASFKTMTGDAVTGEALFKDIEQATDEMRMNLKATADAAAGLFSADVAADQLVPTLRLLGDLARGDEVKLKALALAYGKVADEGTVSSRALLAFGAQGVHIQRGLEKVMGLDSGGIKKALDDDAVSFGHLQRAMVAATSEGGIFFKGLEHRADTFKGKIDLLGNSWEDFKWDLGKILIDELGLNGFVETLTKGLDAGRDNLGEFRPLIREMKSLAISFGEALFDAFKHGSLAASKLINLLNTLSLTGDGKSPGESGTPDINGRKWTWTDRNLNLGGLMDQIAVNDTSHWKESWLGSIGLSGEASTARRFGRPSDMWGESKKSTDLLDTAKLQEEFENFKKSLFGKKGWDWNDVWGTMAKHAKEASEGLRLASEESRKLADAQKKLAQGIRDDMNPFEKVRREIAELQEAGLKGAFKVAPLPHWDAKQAAADARQVEADTFKFGIGKKLKGLLGNADGLDKDLSIITKGSSEDAAMRISSANARLIKPENKLLEAIKEGNRLAEEERKLMEELYDLWQDRKIPGFF